ncbi:MAG: SAM-dependent DNA methyltransferase, partial [Candidatus Aminicenantes bacterium]|nr:SAM-dependent DNA methyltransferase [Candidatus Aminicenantes bacterium]
VTLSERYSEKKQVLNAVSWRDETAEKVIKKKEGGEVFYEPDVELRDTENVLLGEDIDEYLKREVLPHVPDAWIDYDKTIRGYEISFSKYFYKYEPLRSLEGIKVDILVLEAESEGLLAEILS